jgi:hypothetical protein
MEGIVRKWFYMIVLLIFLFFLSGCEQKTNVNFSSDEKWSWKSSVDFDAGLFKDVGSIAGSLLEEFTGSGIPSGLFNVELYLNPMMNMLKNTLRSEGVNFDWNYDKEKLTYEISGTNYDFLERAGLITIVGGNQYRLAVNSDDLLSMLDPEYQQMITQMNQVFGNNEFQIVAGEIIDSNANEQTRTKATWYNPTNIEVVFVPGSSSNAGPLFLLLIGIVLIVLIFFLLGKNLGKSTCPSCGGKVSRKTVDCPHCGSYLGFD